MIKTTRLKNRFMQRDADLHIALDNATALLLIPSTFAHTTDGILDALFIVNHIVSVDPFYSLLLLYNIRKYIFY